MTNCVYPPTAPTIARPKPLQPKEPLKTPSLPTRPRASAAKKAPASMKSQPPRLTPQPVEKNPSVVKPAPSLPALSDVAPFTKPKQATVSPKRPETRNIEQALKRKIPNIQPPPSRPRMPIVSRERSKPKPKPKTSSPKISAPQMASMPQVPKPQSAVPPKPNMSDTVKKLMEGLKSTTRVPALPKISQKNIQPPSTKPTPVAPSPSVLDQRIAKLAIPEVVPVESIKQRLQLLEVPAAGNPGESTSKTSPGKNRYLAMVEDTIDRHWVAPPLLASNPVVVLNFKIARSGEISGIRITESSGHTHYDSSVKRAVQAVNPLPQFPSDISTSFLDVTFRFIKE